MAKDMIATKAFTYATRRLQPGEPFSASDRDGRLLFAAKKAKYGSPRAEVDLAAPDAGSAAAIGKAVESGAVPAAAGGTVEGGSAVVGERATGSELAPPSELAQLRKEAKVLGLRVSPGWNADKLREKIAEKKAQA